MTYFLFFEHYYHYNIYAIISISLYRTDGTSCCLLFFIFNTFVIRKTGKTATIHGCRLIILHTLPTIPANVASWLSTYTKVYSLNWYSCYCGLVYRIIIILITIQGDFLIVLHLVKRFVWYLSIFTKYSYYREFYCSWPASRLCDRDIVDFSFQFLPTNILSF